jgi:hypothetical protein
MYTLMWELARDRQRTLLAEAAAMRLANEVARSRAGGAHTTRRPAALRERVGRRLIALGSHLAGAAAPLDYRRPAVGGRAR